MSNFTDDHIILIILAAAVVTYLTRIGGYLLLSVVSRIPPRVEAALNAIPAAVLTTLVAPAFYAGGWETKLAMAAALLVGLRYTSPLPMIAIGWAVVMIARYFVIA
ncbi:AzlD family protein [Martelella mediterranea]|uniref:AzlD family protein n=1 Tax=Martelella mediterranea TaxID=293089 RepID=UPI001E3DDCD5|nr:AzlD family protein [Martelella mediterranea]MCD1636760.1 AzlD family protein [Martelella mediterranea]